jgi:hypothetical protein
MRLVSESMPVWFFPLNRSLFASDMTSLHCDIVSLSIVERLFRLGSGVDLYCESVLFGLADFSEEY